MILCHKRLSKRDFINSTDFISPKWKNCADPFYSQSSFTLFIFPFFSFFLFDLNRKWLIVCTHKICVSFCRIIYYIDTDNRGLKVPIPYEANISTTKSQTGNILGVSKIWRHWKVSYAIRFFYWMGNLVCHQWHTKIICIDPVWLTIHQNVII